MKTWFFPAVLAKGRQAWSIFDIACAALSLCHLKAMNSTIFQITTQADLSSLLPINAWHTCNCQQLICWSARIIHYCLDQRPFISALFLDVFEDRNSLWALRWHSSWGNNHLVWGSSACQWCRWEATLDQSSACFSRCCKDVRKNGFPCKAWLAGCTEARRTLPSSSLASCRVTQEPAGFLTLCLKIGVSQLARAQRGSGREVVRRAGGRGWQPTCYPVPGNPNSPQVSSKGQKEAKLACKEYMGRD